MIRMTLIFAILAQLGCQTGNNIHGSAPLVELRTGGCFGYCPIIRLTVRHDGWVEYAGGQFAERQGLDSFRLTGQEIKQLRRDVQKANLWQYPDKIESQVVDAPWSTLIVYRDGVSKSVLGSMDRPAPLLELENAIKNLAEAHGFQVKQGVNPKEPPAGTRREVTVTLRSDLNAGNWIAQFKDVRLLLIRRVSAENKWIVAFDPAEISEKGLIELFRSTAGVLGVQK